MHITTVHPRHDTRIFHKECVSLASSGHDVVLIVADGKGDELREDVTINDIGLAKGRMHRVLALTYRAAIAALKLNADIYHFHDPELLLMVRRLKKSGAVVIFDDHEDFPLQLYKKHYIPNILKKPTSLVSRKLIDFFCSKADGVIAATNHISKKHLDNSVSATDVNNYPSIREFKDYKKTPNQPGCVSYILTGLTEVRAVKELVLTARSNSGIFYQITGSFLSNEYKQKVLSLAGTNVEFTGRINREKVLDLLARTKVGIALSYHKPSSMHSQPTKIYEYMLAGVPVICSNIPFWESIVVDNGCGISVDPTDINKISEKINFLIDNPDIATAMGERGRQAVIKKYTWEGEFKKLILFYEQSLKR